MNDEMPVSTDVYAEILAEYHHQKPSRLLEAQDPFLNHDREKWLKQCRVNLKSKKGQELVKKIEEKYKRRER